MSGTVFRREDFHPDTFENAQNKYKGDEKADTKSELIKISESVEKMLEGLPHAKKLSYIAFLERRLEKIAKHREENKNENS